MKVSTGTKFNFLSPEEQERYQKHLTLKEIGIEGQLKIKNSSVLCIGAGGLGSSVMLYLAAAGIGKIGIIDNDIVEKLYLEHSDCKPCPIFKTDIVTASMVKYCINSFLATKVTFMNEMYDVLKKAKGADWRTFTSIIENDPRIGKTHMKVPGNDGQRGYAGSCFPKDTNALAWFAREILNTPFTQLETSIKINEKLRKK